jgi:predicted phage terminase large subunit-like protein
LIPAGDQNTKYVFIGNKVHNDSLMMKLKAAIELGKMKGIYREYPLIDEKGKIAWPGKFPNMKAIEKLKGTYASEIDYLREQMLMILPDGDTIIKPEDIHHYKELPIKKPDYYLISIDPAFSEKSTADNTAVLVLAVYKENKTIRTYVLNSVLNKKLETDQLIKEVKKIIGTFNKQVVFRVFVEDVSAQTAIVQMLQYANIPAEGVGIGGKDKKTRLSAIAPFVKNGQILFPIKGVEELINQLLYFGTERYDDLVDALTLAINKIIREENNPSGQVLVVGMKQSPYYAAVKNPPKITNGIYSHSLDWADRDDQEIFRDNKISNPQRIYESP